MRETSLGKVAGTVGKMDYKARSELIDGRLQTRALFMIKVDGQLHNGRKCWKETMGWREALDMFNQMLAPRRRRTSNVASSRSRPVKRLGPLGVA